MLPGTHLTKCLWQDDAIDKLEGVVGAAGRRSDGSRGRSGISPSGKLSELRSLVLYLIRLLLISAKKHQYKKPDSDVHK